MQVHINACISTIYRIRELSVWLREIKNKIKKSSHKHQQIDMKYTSQFLDLEKKLQLFFENLEYYSTLTSQPINFSKTKGL